MEEENMFPFGRQLKLRQKTAAEALREAEEQRDEAEAELKRIEDEEAELEREEET